MMKRNPLRQLILTILLVISCSKIFSQTSSLLTRDDKIAKVLIEAHLINAISSDSTLIAYYFEKLNHEESLVYLDSSIPYKDYTFYTWGLVFSNIFISCLYDKSDFRILLGKDGYSNSEKISKTNYKLIIERLNDDFILTSFYFNLIIPSRYYYTGSKYDLIDFIHCGKVYTFYNNLLKQTLNIKIMHNWDVLVYSNQHGKWIDYFEFDFPIFHRTIGKPLRGTQYKYLEE